MSAIPPSPTNKAGDNDGEPDVARTTSSTPSNPLAVAEPESLGALIALQYTLFQQTGDHNYIKAMRKAILGAAPGLKTGPHMADNGVQAFYDFNEPLSEENARMVLHELKSTSPSSKLPSLQDVMSVHEVISHQKWGDRLPYGSIVTLLAMVEKQRKQNAQDWARIVNTALLSIEVIEETRPGRASSGELSQEHYRKGLEMVQRALVDLLQFAKDQESALIAQHGTAYKNKSIGDLMGKIANSVDVDSQKFYWEQVALVHAFQHASNNNALCEELQKVLEVVQKLLSI